MPVCIINYKPGSGRRELAVELIKNLPDMLVEVMNTCAGMRLTRSKLTIRLAAFDPADYNVPDLEVAVMTSRGAGDRTYNARDRVRDFLKIQLLKWLDKHKELRANADLCFVDADLRFAEMCGVSFSAFDGKVYSSWGNPRD